MWRSVRWRPWLADERLRYVLGGGWNSVFGWAVFAALWQALGEHLSLWTLSIAAHAIATTQAFVVQRRLVFRSTGSGIGMQFVKFQLSYLVLLGVGAFALNALAAQGVHPLAAQFLAMVLLAVCGYVFGKGFTFSPAPLSLTVLGRRAAAGVRAHGVALIACAVSLLAFELVWRRMLSGGTGDTVEPVARALLEGRAWIGSNEPLPGLFNPPWFTAAAGGGAFYADPRALFYSPLQMLALAVDPVRALHLNALLFAAAAFWASYALVRKLLAWPVAAAVALAVLGAALTFPWSAAPESGGQYLAIWPLLVLALCWPRPALPTPWALPWPAIGVALCLTAWLQFGFAAQLLPAVLGALLPCLVLARLGRTRLIDVAGRLALGVAIALALNASKLYESISFLRHVPRGPDTPFVFARQAPPDQAPGTLLNPACLVHPEANACKPGDGFDLADPRQRAQSERLRDRKPLDAARPAASRLSSWLSQTSFWILLVLLTLSAWQRLLAFARDDGAAPAPRPPDPRDRTV